MAAWPEVRVTCGREYVTLYLSAPSVPTTDQARAVGRASSRPSVSGTCVDGHWKQSRAMGACGGRPGRSMWVWPASTWKVAWRFQSARCARLTRATPVCTARCNPTSNRSPLTPPMHRKRARQVRWFVHTNHHDSSRMSVPEWTSPGNDCWQIRRLMIRGCSL